MGRRVSVISGKGPIALPNKTVLMDDGSTAVLSDAQWAQVQASHAYPNLLNDLGAATSPDDPSGGGGGVTPEELATDLALKQDAATAATDDELAAGLAGKADVTAVNTALATKADATATSTAIAAAQAYAVQRANHTGTQTADTITDGSTNKAYTATEKTKLAGVATGATANATDAQLRDRSTHTGTQAASTITGLAAVATSGAKADVGLGSVDNTADTAKPVSTAQAAADSAVQAYAIQRGNHTGTQAASTITGLAAVATSGAKADVGLGNVDNTSDANKPVSTAQAAADGLRLLADTTGVTDGQLFAWSTALGKAVPVAPTGSALGDSRSNVTGTGITLTVGGTASADIPGLTPAVSGDARRQYMKMGCTFQQTALGDGNLTLYLTDMTAGGAGVGVFSAGVRLPNTTSAGVKTVVFEVPEWELGVLLTSRNYKVTAAISAPSGTPAVTILNTAAYPSWARVWFR